MYLVAFAVTWLLFRRESKRLGAPWTEDEAANFFMWSIVGILIGGRLAGTLIYEPTNYYWIKPWFIFWPFDESGAFVGFQGMSYHGGFVGLIITSLIWCKVHKWNWLDWADLIAVSAPLGYTFGRIGNFINGELWGKVSTAPWAMIFPNAERFSAREPWVQDVARKVGIRLVSMNDMVNLPRHPSQLYEAILEGLVLWLILGFLCANTVLTEVGVSRCIRWDMGLRASSSNISGNPILAWAMFCRSVIRMHPLRSLYRSLIFRWDRF